MSDDLEFIVIDDIPEYIFCIGDDEENERVIALSGKDGAFKYEKVDELPTAGEDGVLYLVPKSHTTQTASGNPINVNITYNAGKIESLKLDGDTFQQTYTGKNLFNADTETLAFIDSNGNIIAGSTWSCSYYIKVSPNTTYAWHGEQAGSLGGQVIWAGYDSSQAFISGQYAQVNNTAGTSFTTGASTEYVRVGYRNDRLENMQLELGSTATSYEPYVGGQPSPNPSYPQDINVVTGTQTISINGTNYPISLGSLELCKIGTYQDYIWKDGDSWKVHKATAKTILDSSSFGGWSSTTAAEGYFRSGSAQIGFPSNLCFCNRLLPRTEAHGSYEYIWTQPTDIGAVYIQILATRLESADITGFNNWINSVKPILFYTLTTATDTTITDTTLIAQLEAVRTAALSTGSNTISNTATGTNLAGDLEIGYYGYDPLNKYDKYFWLDIDGGYESL